MTQTNQGEALELLEDEELRLEHEAEAGDDQDGDEVNRLLEEAEEALRKPDVKEAAPDADSEPQGGDRLIPVKEAAKLRAKIRDLTAKVDELQRTQKPAEELARELEERFLDDPGAVLAELQQQNQQQAQKVREEQSIARAIGTIGEDEFARRYQVLDRYFADNPHERRTLDVILNHDDDPAGTLMALALEVEEASVWMDPVKRQEMIRQEALRLQKEGLKGSIKERIIEGRGPGLGGVSASSRGSDRLVTQPRQVLLTKSEAELEAEAELDE